jgi:3-isopropylmalate/(R)-2-methylmalate dehydratase small subunit
MKKLTSISGRAIPFGRRNVDTDLIIAASHLKTLRRAGLGRHAFAAVRAEAGNVFDEPAFAGAPILIAGDNFGCGSSREHAAWALADMGIEAVIAPGFSDIFAGNAFRNGIAAIVLPGPAVEHLLDVARDHVISVDLEAMIVSAPTGDRYGFEMDEFRRDCLMAGLDEIALSLSYEAAIRAYELRTGT